MPVTPSWQYDETRQVGTDYSDPREAERFEQLEARLGETQAAQERILDWLGVGPRDTLIDVGAGAGGFALRAARRCRRVYAVDVSPAMLARARQRACDAGVTNIEFHQGGFLTYEHVGEPVSAAVSQLALHHLPDVWKLVGLKRLAGLMKDEGRFYLRDVVYTFDPADYAEFFSGSIGQIAGALGPQIGREFETHVREEFSTLDWIMDGLIRKAGFKIVRRELGQPAEYYCTKKHSDDWLLGIASF